MEMVWLEAGMFAVRVLLRCAIQETKPDVGVINIDSDAEKAFTLIQKLKPNLRSVLSSLPRPEQTVNRFFERCELVPKSLSLYQSVSMN